MWKSRVGKACKFVNMNEAENKYFEGEYWQISWHFDWLGRFGYKVISCMNLKTWMFCEDISWFVLEASYSIGLT